MKIVQTLSAIAVPILIWLLTQRVEESRRAIDEAWKRAEQQTQERATGLQEQLVTIQSKQRDALDAQVENQQMQIFLPVYHFCASPNTPDLIFATKMLAPLLHLPDGPKQVRQGCLESAANNSNRTVYENADIGLANSTPAESLEKTNAAGERILDQDWLLVVTNVGSSRLKAQHFINIESNKETFPSYKLCASPITSGGFGI